MSPNRTATARTHTAPQPHAPAAHTSRPSRPANADVARAPHVRAAANAIPGYAPPSRKQITDALQEAEDRKSRHQKVFQVIGSPEWYTPAGTLRAKDTIKIGLDAFEVVMKTNKGPGMMELKIATPMGDRLVPMQRDALVPIVRLADPAARKRMRSGGNS